jgi:hypothetical protein
MMMIVAVNYDSYAADVMWNCAPVLYWSAVEVHLSIIACKSALLPLLRLFINKTNDGKKAASPSYDL